MKAVQDEACLSEQQQAGGWPEGNWEKDDDSETVGSLASSAL